MGKEESRASLIFYDVCCNYAILLLLGCVVCLERKGSSEPSSHRPVLVHENCRAKILNAQKRSRSKISIQGTCLHSAPDHISYHHHPLRSSGAFPLQWLLRAHLRSGPAQSSQDLLARQKLAKPQPCLLSLSAAAAQLLSSKISLRNARQSCWRASCQVSARRPGP